MKIIKFDKKKIKMKENLKKLFKCDVLEDSHLSNKKIIHDLYLINIMIILQNIINYLMKINLYLKKIMKL